MYFASPSKQSGKFSEPDRCEMIIEICGPPGVGKTTLACALTARLTELGLAADLVSSYRPSEQPVPEGARRTGVLDPLRRLIRPAHELLTDPRGLTSSSPAMNVTNLLLRSLPPRSIISTFRLRQYIWRFSYVWFKACSQDRIVVFDQAFVQLICSLILLSSAASDTLISRALTLVPRPDLLIRLTAPRKILEVRLAERHQHQTWIERRLEFDLHTNLRAIGIFEYLHPLLTQHGWYSICIDMAKPQAHGKALARIEQNIVDRLAIRAEAG
jgi:thymidylate kinase